MYEVVLSVTLVMIVMALVVPRLSATKRRGDEQARFTLSAVMDAEVVYLEEHGHFAGYGDLPRRLPRIQLLSASNASNDASEASVAYNQNSGQVGLGALGTTRCWLARLNGTETLWAVKDPDGACTGDAALSVNWNPPDDDPSRGSSPDRPIILTPGGGGGGGGTTTTISTTTTTAAPGTTTTTVLTTPQTFPTTPVSGAHQVDGTAEAVAIVGNTVYVAGDFANVLDSSGNFVAARANVAAFDATTGQLVAGFRADTDGSVRSIEASNGKLFLAGLFTTVGGSSRRGFASVDAATGATQSWAANTNNSGSGRTVAVANGSVYLVGDFTSVGGVARNRAAKVSEATAAVDSSWNPNLDNIGYAVDVSPDGTTVYLGGRFLTVGGSSRLYAAAVSSTTGAVLPVTFPAVTAYVLDVDVSGDGSQLAVGVAGAAGPGNRAVLVSTTTGAAVWNRECNGDVQDVYNLGTSTYIALHDDCDGRTGARVLELDRASNTVNTSWLPTMTEDDPTYGGARQVAASGNVLAVVGHFRKVNGQSHRGVVLFRKS